MAQRQFLISKGPGYWRLVLALFDSQQVTFQLANEESNLWEVIVGVSVRGVEAADDLPYPQEWTLKGIISDRFAPDCVPYGAAFVARYSLRDYKGTFVVQEK